MIHKRKDKCCELFYKINGKCRRTRPNPPEKILLMVCLASVMIIVAIDVVDVVDDDDADVVVPTM